MEAKKSTPQPAGGEKVFKKDLTVLEQYELSLQIQRFIQKRIPTLVKYKLSQLVDTLNKQVEPYTKLNGKLIDELGDNQRLSQYSKDGSVNPKFDEYRKQIEPVEKEKSTISFKQYPVSYIIRKDDGDDEGGYPMVYKLFYEDDLAIRLFEKWMEEKTKALEAELNNPKAE